jgi:hypothetical protein
MLYTPKFQLLNAETVSTSSCCYYTVHWIKTVIILKLQGFYYITFLEVFHCLGGAEIHNSLNFGCIIIEV